MFWIHPHGHPSATPALRVPQSREWPEPRDMRHDVSVEMCQWINRRGQRDMTFLILIWSRQLWKFDLSAINSNFTTESTSVPAWHCDSSFRVTHLQHAADCSPEEQTFDPCSPVDTNRCLINILLILSEIGARVFLPTIVIGEFLKLDPLKLKVLHYYSTSTAIRVVWRPLH